MKTDDEEKQKHYRSSIKTYQDTIKNLQKIDAEMIAECRKDPASAALKLFELADVMLNLTSNHLIINGISRSIFNSRDEVSLNEARKTIFKALIYIENIVGAQIDAPFSEYEEKLADLAEVSPEKKCAMVRKIGFTIALLKYNYGDNTKWRWAFVDIDGRYAVAAKNLFDLKNAVANIEPTSAHYATTLEHYNLLKEQLAQAADKYYERFELSTRRPDDLLQAIRLLGALYKILVMMSEREAAEFVQKKSNKWETNYEMELQKIHQNKSSGAAQK